MTVRNILPGILILTACAGAPTPEPPPGPDLSPVHLPDLQDLRLASHRISETTAMGQQTTVSMHVDYALQAVTSGSETGRSIQFIMGERHRADGQVFDMVPSRDLNGVVVTMSVDPRGLLGEFDVDDPSLAGDVALGQITSVLRQFYPRVPVGGIIPGATWTDTTHFQRTQEGADIGISAFTEFTAGHWTDTTASRELLVEWSRRYTVSGNGEQLGIAFTVDGNGVSRGTHMFGADGQFRQTVVFDSSSSEFTVPSMGMSSPLVQTGADTIRAGS